MSRAELRNDPGLLMDLPQDWEEVWGGMPSFGQENLAPWHSISVRFKTKEGRDEFAAKLGQEITDRTRSKWHPKMEAEKFVDKVYEGTLQPRYPIYVPTKGRWKSRKTIRTLIELGVDFTAVIEKEEYDNYAAVVDPAKLVVLPFSNQGLVPARNFCWQHSIDRGFEKHWQIDDNILHFYRLYKNEKIQLRTGTCFRAMEDWADRYENTAFVGPQYHFFAPRSRIWPGLVLNTRVYSCYLIKNDLPFRFRGFYNDDTRICIDALKAGYVTALFNAFLAGKSATMTVQGGMTGHYQGEGRRKMAEELANDHPDVTTVIERWGRVQHLVNYKPFKRNKLITKPGIKIPEGTNEYGLTFRDLSATNEPSDEEWAAQLEREQQAEDEKWAAAFGDEP